MPVLDEIRVYPIKSLPGLWLEQAEVCPKGLKFDRRMMVVDSEGQFMTQRTEPLLSQFNLELKGQQIVIQSRLLNGQSIKVSVQQEEKTGIMEKAVVWDDEVEVIGISSEADEFFSAHLGRRCRLVQFPETALRAVDPDYAIGADQVSLADGFPFMMVSKESLTDLNSRLDSSVVMERFRPNFIISGIPPYGEDNLRNFVIGEVQFSGVKPCSRCNLITIDPVTGISGKEPLATLSAYRSGGGKVYFGQNLIARSYGFIKKGDVVAEQ